MQEQEKEFVAIDFEFNRVTEKELNLVCAVTVKGTEVKRWWLHKDIEEQDKLIAYLINQKVFIAHNAVAECRSFLTLGLRPEAWNWIDNFLEYRCLSNHNDELNYGKQLVDGKVKMTMKPKKKWDLAPGEKAEAGFKPTSSLAEVTYKLLGIIRDTKEKDEVRDLIISEPEEFNELEKERILKYCEEDVKDLLACYQAIKKMYLQKVSLFSEKSLLDSMFSKGRYAALTAYMESWGYPIDYDATKNFSDQVTSILFDCQREINTLFPNIKPFKWDKKEQKFKWNQGVTKLWIERASGFADRWDKTDTGMFALSLEAFTKFYDYKHDYPTDSFGAQMVRYLKLKQSLNGFMPQTNPAKRTFWSAVGEDKRVRPYMNIYGSQSSRSQPAATTFLMLKPAWMRSLLMPEPGKFICGIDYASQEFLISALEAQDENMIESYRSGDVYLAFAKLIGEVPPDGKKEDYKKQRDLCKATVLGLSYNMTKYGLAIKLSQDTGRQWTEDEAQGQIDLFFEAYPDLKKFGYKLQRAYEEDGYLALPDGWVMFGDNDNPRSVGNFPSQGMGAAIMRKAVELAMDKGIKVILTLHDALYMEGECGKERQILELEECMAEAFSFYYKDSDYYEDSKIIRLEPFAWSRNYKKDCKLKIGDRVIDASNMYVDSRAESEWKKFSQYFNRPKELEL